jgi:hypothetical protein
MTISKKILTTALTVIAVPLLLTGCIAVESAPQGSEQQPPATQSAAPEQSPAPAEEITDAPTVDATEPADADGDDAAPTEFPATEEPDENAVDLSAEDGTVYLHAVQAFSPRLERWVVDGDTLIFQELDCLGRTKKDVTANLVDTGANTFLATWEGDNPLINSPQSALTITDTALTPDYGEIASSRAEAQADIYQNMCIEAGGSIASFIF